MLNPIKYSIFQMKRPIIVKILFTCFGKFKNMTACKQSPISITALCSNTQINLLKAADLHVYCTCLRPEVPVNQWHC